MKQKRLLGEILVEQGVISLSEQDEALACQKEQRAAGEMHTAAAVLEPLARSAQNPLVRERANFLLGEIFEEQGDLTRAISYYRQVINLNLGSSSRLVEKAKERIERIEISKSGK